MYMPYSKNPHMPRVRMLAVRAVYQGKSLRQVARYFGVMPSTISKWMKRDTTHGFRPIETKSSRPHYHPLELKEEIVEAIVAEKERTKRSADVIYHILKRKGVGVSLNSVKRTLRRKGLVRVRSPWKRWHTSIERPLASKPGDLVQVDTIHFMIGTKRIYVYTLIDLYSRWAYALASERINTRLSIRFLRRAEALAPFKFEMVQSDHGSEWSSHFTERVGIAHRHSRVRQSNDNAHIERFNRTVQEECLDRVVPSVANFNQALKVWLKYYNHERLHYGLNFKTPSEVV